MWSWGVPHKNYDSASELQRLLIPDRIEPEVAPEAARISDSDLLQRFTIETWQRSLRNFHHGRAPDACGWTQEIVLEFSRHPRMGKILREIAMGVLTSRWSSNFLDLLVAGRVIAIYKNGHGSIRPIAIPSIWRELVGTWTTNAWYPQLKEWVGPRQYGVGCSNRTILMAHDITRALEENAGWAAVHLDISAAFTNVSRASLIAGLAKIDPALLMSQSHWIRRPSPFLLRATDGTHAMYRAEVGVPQGDPLSSWAFAVVLQLAMAEFDENMKRQGMTAEQDYRCRAYVDDMVLTAQLHVLPAMIVAWEEALKRIGLSLQREKMQIYCPDVEPREMAEEFGCSEACCSADGMVICGLPLTQELTDTSQDKQELAIGRLTCQSHFLHRKLEQLRVRAHALCVIAQDLPSHGAHIATQLLHGSLPASCVCISCVACVLMLFCRGPISVMLCFSKHGCRSCN